MQPILDRPSSYSEQYGSLFSSMYSHISASVHARIGRTCVLFFFLFVSRSTNPYPERLKLSSRRTPVTTCRFSPLCSFRNSQQYRITLVGGKPFFTIKACMDIRGFTKSISA